MTDRSGYRPNLSGCILNWMLRQGEKITSSVARPDHFVTPAAGD
ncbi:hypothetical protein [Rhizohabitans arisaemae]|nr:hypothetical protein [Rhizohabitans arisaemae]